MRIYALLGFTLAFQDRADAPRYAVVRHDGVELHLQWHDPTAWDHPGDRPTYRSVVDDVDRLLADFEKIPQLDRTAVGDPSWGTRELYVHDPDRNGLRFYRDL